MVACRRVAAREPPDGGFPLLTTKTYARQQQNRLATPRRASVPQNGRPGEHCAAEATALRQAAPDPAGAVQGPRPMARAPLQARNLNIGASQPQPRPQPKAAPAKPHLIRTPGHGVAASTAIQNHREIVRRQIEALGRREGASATGRPQQVMKLLNARTPDLPDAKSIELLRQLQVILRLPNPASRNSHLAMFVANNRLVAGAAVAKPATAAAPAPAPARQASRPAPCARPPGRRHCRPARLKRPDRLPRRSPRPSLPSASSRVFRIWRHRGHSRARQSRRPSPPGPPVPLSASMTSSLAMEQRPRAAGRRQRRPPAHRQRAAAIRAHRQHQRRADPAAHPDHRRLHPLRAG